MSDLAQKVEEAADQVRVDWSPARARRVEERMGRTRVRRARTRAAIGAALVLAALGSIVGYGYRATRHAPTIAKNVPTSPSTSAIRFADGSTATPLDARSVVESKQVGPNQIEVALIKGAARFEVTKNPGRLFRVTTGNLAVEVLGTAFTVEPTEGGNRVLVHHGRVRVRCGEQASEITDGQASLCASLPSAAPVSSSSASEAPVGSASAVAAPKSAWKSLARDGEFDKAYDALKLEGASAVKDEPAELLLAADVARLSHHPAQAVPHLRRVIDKHGSDPRAPLAAFTLGRVLLEELGRPKEAAEAFAKSRALSPGGALSEDALAREVEAWSRAGDATRAKERAEEYVAKYPKGLRLRSVKKYGGIE